jgi:hypothetical protein
MLSGMVHHFQFKKKDALRAAAFSSLFSFSWLKKTMHLEQHPFHYRFSSLGYPSPMHFPRWFWPPSNHWVLSHLIPLHMGRMGFCQYLVWHMMVL